MAVVIGIGSALVDGFLTSAEESPGWAEADAGAGAAADEPTGTLLPPLQQAMPREGPGEAVLVCSERALALTAEVGARHPGVQTRRTSPRADSVVRAGADGTRELRALRPIMMKVRCQACHRPPDRMATEVRAAPANWHLGDESTGFAVGKLRGLVSARLAVE
ncbi:MAG: hypothetical protein IPJ41_03600 [Phycisphaerales bacterium]|nr:hypothetical protein [Phycisphaerales bacterium]